MRLKPNEGKQSTLYKTSFPKIWTAPMCVTKVVSPFGRLTWVFRVAIIDVFRK